MTKPHLGRLATKAEILQHLDSSQKLFSKSIPYNANLLAVETSQISVPAYYKTLFMEVEFNMRSPEETLSVQRVLIYIMNRITIVNQHQALELYLNFMKTFNYRIIESVNAHLVRYDFELATVTIDDFVQAYTPLVDFSDLDSIKNINTNHAIFVMGIISNLIGKHLNSLNYSNWYAAREKSYAAKSDVSLDDIFLPKLRLTSDLCAAIYSTVSTKWEIRRVLFLYIKKVAREDQGVLSNALKVTMVLLRGAEMTNFVYIMKYIMVMNPILLGWNELAKYAPQISAASEKFFSLPPDSAFYLKLILPQDQTTEFQSANLAVPYTVAVALAREEGQRSSVNIQGLMDTATTPIVSAALRLVAFYGGANTITTNAVRNWEIDSIPNAKMLNALSFGADEATEENQKGLGEIHLN